MHCRRVPSHQFLDIPTPSGASASPPLLAFDPHWLAITRAFQPLLSLSAHQPSLPTDLTVRKGTVEAHLAWVRETLPGGGEGIAIASVQQFQMTAPAPGTPGGDVRGPGPWYTNPQTEALCEMLELRNKVNPVPEEVRLARQQEQMAQPEPLQKQGAPATVAEEPTAPATLYEAEPAAV
jgi:lariat debranching enzyme